VRAILTPALGPTLISTITTDQIDGCVADWCDYLHQRIHSQTRLSVTQANAWNFPEMAGTRVIWLENMIGDPWLRIIEDPQAATIAPFHKPGWLSLEICVIDVDSLSEELRESPFEIIGEPADLDISPDIRAMQVVGSAGEVLYLTQIKAPVPGFDLPAARCAVDKLFIPILIATNRDSAAAVYEQFPHTKSSKFDTKITVINRAHDLSIGLRHPVAVIQLAGNNLIEIDEISSLNIPSHDVFSMPPGISMISFAINDLDFLPANTDSYTIKDGPYSECRASLIRGKAGELIELIEQNHLNSYSSK
jgi:hypothetical protein